MSRDLGRIIPNDVYNSMLIKLRRLLQEQPEQALKLMKEDPVAIIIFSKIKAEMLQLCKSNPNVQKFFDLFNAEVAKLFTVDTTDKDTIELAFTVELLLEKWRTEFQSNEFQSHLDFIANTIDTLAGKLDPQEDNLSTRIFIEMLNDFHERESSLEDYLRKKFRAHWKSIHTVFSNYIQEVFVKNKNEKQLSAELQALLFLATMSPIVAREFRSQLSKELHDAIADEFAELEEEYKFLIAPWFKALTENAKIVQQKLREDKLPDHPTFKKQKEEYVDPSDDFYT